MVIMYGSRILDYITMHYFQLKAELAEQQHLGSCPIFRRIKNDDGYENIVVIAVGQTNISQFNNNFCANSDLPLVMDPPCLPIREQFTIVNLII